MPILLLAQIRAHWMVQMTTQNKHFTSLVSVTQIEICLPLMAVCFSVSTVLLTATQSLVSSLPLAFDFGPPFFGC